MLIAPSQDVEPFLRPTDRHLLGLARTRNLPLVHSKTCEGEISLIRSLEPISIVLALNKESMILDPIDWPALKKDIREWGERYCPDLVISDVCDALFKDRLPPSHSARVGYKPTPEPCGAYHFFFPHLGRNKNEESHLIDSGISPEVATLIDRANRHDQTLSVLGILPNQLRKIMRLTDVDAEKAWTDLSKTLFWQGYNIWCTRKHLMRRFWKETAPKEWIKKRKKDRRKNKTLNVSQCHDPFHFLRKIDDSSKERSTKCFCSITSKKSLKNTDIRIFTTPISIKILSPFEMKRQIMTKSYKSTVQEIHRTNRFKVQSDLIREQQDREKRRKY